MSAQKTPKYRHHGNPVMAAALAELRRSNAAGPHLDRRTRRARTRADAARAAVRDQA
jgi:hypothetical protein